MSIGAALAAVLCIVTAAAMRSTAVVLAIGAVTTAAGVLYFPIG